MISWTFYEFIIWIVAGCKIKMLWGFFIGKHLVPILVLFQDAFRFVGMMSIIAIAGTIFSIYDLLVAGDPVFDAIVTGLDVITICVPPALPSALTIGIHYAVSRLIYHDCVPRNYSSFKKTHMVGHKFDSNFHFFRIKRNFMYWWSSKTKNLIRRIFPFYWKLQLCRSKKRF